jgi:hypothetical protein
MNFTPMYDGSFDYSKYFCCNLDLSHFSIEELVKNISQKNLNVNDKIRIVNELYSHEPSKIPLTR